MTPTHEIVSYQKSLDAPKEVFMSKNKMNRRTQIRNNYFNKEYVIQVTNVEYNFKDNSDKNALLVHVAFQNVYLQVSYMTSVSKSELPTKKYKKAAKFNSCVQSATPCIMDA